MIGVEDVTVGMFVRERYNIAAASIDSLREHTPDGTHLMYLDADTPQAYRSEIDAALRRFGDFTVLRAADYLLPIQATNRLIEACETDVLALVQNDVIAHNDWLTPAIDALNEEGADYVSPEIMESRAFPVVEDGKLTYHFNPVVSELVDLPDGKMESRVKRQPGPGDSITEVEKRRPIKHLEEHAFIGRTAAFREVAPFPEFLNTREQIAMAVEMHRAGQSIVLEPKSSLTYIEIPLRDDEIPHYLQRWDADRALASNLFVEARYKLHQYKSSMPAVTARISKALRLQSSFVAAGE